MILVPLLEVQRAFVKWLNNFQSVLGATEESCSTRFIVISWLKGSTAVPALGPIASMRYRTLGGASAVSQLQLYSRGEKSSAMKLFQFLGIPFAVGRGPSSGTTYR